MDALDIGVKNILLILVPTHEPIIETFNYFVITLSRSKNNYNVTYLFEDSNSTPKRLADHASLCSVTNEDLINFHAYDICLFNKLLPNIEPDIVIYASGSVDCSKIGERVRQYFTCLVLSIDSSIFTRTPFASMLSLDPVGHLPYSYLLKYWPQISLNFKLDEKQRNKTLWLKHNIRNYLLQTSPFHETINRLVHFDKLILLPLNTYTPIEYDSYTAYITNILTKIPMNIGVIVTVHPHSIDCITTEQIESLKKIHANLIHEKILYDYLYPSQYLLAHVDAVVFGTFSTLAFQALIWDVKVICIEPIMPFLNDSSIVTNVIAVLNEPHRDKNALLFWILSHYSFFNDKRYGGEQYLNNNDFLTFFLENAFFCFKSGSFLNFYQEIDSYEIYFDKIVSYLNGEAVKRSPRS